MRRLLRSTVCCTSPLQAAAFQRRQAILQMGIFTSSGRHPAVPGKRPKDNWPVLKGRDGPSGRQSRGVFGMGCRRATVCRLFRRGLDRRRLADARCFNWRAGGFGGEADFDRQSGRGGNIDAQCRLALAELLVALRSQNVIL